MYVFDWSDSNRYNDDCLTVFPEKYFWGRRSICGDESLNMNIHQTTFILNIIGNNVLFIYDWNARLGSVDPDDGGLPDHCPSRGMRMLWAYHCLRACKVTFILGAEMYSTSRNSRDVLCCFERILLWDPTDASFRRSGQRVHICKASCSSKQPRPTHT